MNSLAMFEFTDDDLKSNKRGFISARQSDVIESMAGGIRSSSWSSLWVGMFFLFFGLCLILGMFLSNESSRAVLFSSPSNMISLALIVPVVLGILALAIAFAYKRADRLSNSELKMAEGIVRMDETHSSETGSAYYVIIGKTKFVFPEDISATFHEGKSYRIFYCETSMLKYILSFEKVD